MKVLIFLTALFSVACDKECWYWDRQIDIEDNRACNAARSGEGRGYFRYTDCLYSLGYSKVYTTCEEEK